MNRFFLHIPRTGGSSIWTGLAELSSATDVEIIDIYHLSVSRFENPGHTREVLQDLSPIDDSRERIFHHHSWDSTIGYIPNPVMATIIRDPIDRMVSEILHYRRLLLTNALPAVHVRYIEKTLGTPLMSMIENKNARVIDILRFAGNLSIYKKYYIRFFTKFIQENQKQSTFRKMFRQIFSGRTESLPDTTNQLAAQVRDQFEIIEFGSVDTAFYKIASRFSLPCAKNNFSHFINKAPERFSLESSDRTELKHLLAEDYIFLLSLQKFEVSA